MKPILRHTLRTVDLRAIAHNARVLAKRMGVPVMAVVKADAYGHGLIPAARAALWGGASALAVAIPEEGVTLRQNGIDEATPILVLGGMNTQGARAAVAFGLTATVFDETSVRSLQAAADFCGVRAEAHVKLDTGMNRIGARTQSEVQETLKAINACPGVRLTGAYTHFADAQDSAFTHAQFERFGALCKALPQGLVLHASASEASQHYPEMRLQMVREGIALYGAVKDAELRPAMRWVSAVVCVKTIAQGDTVSYGRTFTAERETRVATLSVGYGDGYHRCASGHGAVLLRGKRAPILGRICMDQTMVDATDIPGVRAGDEAVLLGAQGEDAITADELGAFADTISYEMLLSTAPRVPRVYIPCGSAAEDD